MAVSDVNPYEVQEAAPIGMPQLDPSSYASQLFWLAIIFAALYVIMARHAIPRIRDVLEKRQNQIQHDIDVAEKAQHQARTARENYEGELSAAKEKAARMLQDTQRGIDEMVATGHHKLSMQLEDLLDDSEKRIAQQRAEAQQRIEPVLHELTVAMVEKVAQVKPAAKDVADAVAAQIKG